MDTLIGTSIGGYTLVKLLGAGGMGSVYLATDPAVGQQVAVKLIRTELDGYADALAAQQALERFRQEARAVAGLDHLHILPLNRYGEEETPQGPRAYMIMQYRPEGSLWDWLRRRANFAHGQLQPTQAEIAAGLPMNWPLGLEEAADYLQQSASALQYAHDRGIVHRDIKPANFLLRVDLHAKHVHLLLSDFGLAKVFTGSSSTKTILGTPTYMAPEQFEGVARPASDQYALAVMIYYLLAGHPPFEGDPMQLMRQHLTTPPPALSSLNPEVSPAIDAVLARALTKQAEQRFPSIAEFAETFERAVKQPQASSSFSFAQNESVSTINQPGGMGSLPLTGHTSRNPLVLPGPGAASPAPGLGMSATPSPSPSPAPTAYAQQPVYPTALPTPYAAGNVYGSYPQQQQYATPARADVYAQPQMQSFMSLPAPGYQQAGDWDQGGRKVGRRSALGWILGGVGAAVVIAGIGTGAYLYLNNGGGGSTPANPALAILKGHTAAVTGVAWLPDGSQLATGSLDGTARLWSAPDGKALKTLEAGGGVNAVAWNPAGKILATGEENRNVELWNAGGSLVKRAADWGAPIKSLAWRQDGNLLFIGTGGNGLHALQISNDKRYGRNTPQVFVNAVVLAPGGTVAGVALKTGRVYFADLAKGWSEVAGIEPVHGEALSLAWSPDGGFVVAGYADGTAVVYDATARAIKYLLKHRGPVYSVAWKPDASASSLVLVSGAADGSVNIWDLNKNQQIIYTAHSDAVLSVSWGPNLLASASKDQTAILWQPPGL